MCGTDGIERIYGFTTVQQAAWRVYVGIPTAVAFASVREYAWQAGFVLLCTVVLCASVAINLNRRIVRPVHALAAAAHAIAGGQSNTRVPLGGPKEIAQTAAAFNAMLDALAQEQDLMRALMDNIPDAIYFKDAQGRFIRVNQAAARKRGLSDPAQLLGKTDFDFIEKEKAQAMFEREQEVLRTGQPMIGADVLEVWTDHPPTWASVTKMPFRDKTGNFVGIFGLSRNITERKQAEAEREQLIQELQAALAEVKTLSGLVPICANCKKIRDDKGFWSQVETYVAKHTRAKFSHGICPECIKKLYPEYVKE
jgi:PAS domain S-box-containing protein